MVGVWLLFMLANRIRRVGGVTGWGMGAGVLVAVFLARIEAARSVNKAGLPSREVAS